MIDRRDLFKIVGAGLVATGQAATPHEHAAQAAIDIANYHPRFFSESEYRAIDRLADIILPSDEQSPGAHAAGVRYYIDTVPHYSEPATQERWKSGLTAVEASAHAEFNAGFGECTSVQQERIVNAMARNEAAPSTEPERFFSLLKDLALEAYVLSETGMKRYLGYRGNTAVSEFRGCTHPEHRT